MMPYSDTRTSSASSCGRCLHATARLGDTSTVVSRVHRETEPLETIPRGRHRMDENRCIVRPTEDHVVRHGGLDGMKWNSVIVKIHDACRRLRLLFEHHRTRAPIENRVDARGQQDGAVCAASDSGAAARSPLGRSITRRRAGGLRTGGQTVGLGRPTIGGCRAGVRAVGMSGGRADITGSLPNRLCRSAGVARPDDP